MADQFHLPPLPEYTLKPQPSLISGIEDGYLSMLILVVAYWVTSGFFHIIDTYDLFPQYRLHTPDEIAKRNRVSRWECARDVILQQIIQFIFGAVLTIFDAPAMIGKEEYDVAVWAQRIRLAQTFIPGAFGLIGLDAVGISKNVRPSYPGLADILNGGKYMLFDFTPEGLVPTFARWELKLAKFIYYLAVPALQWFLAICVLDTWQYFCHRAMHMNKYLYTKFHSRHHRLYVPYAYGAIYNHPVEGFVLDMVGSVVGYLATGMTVRQSMVFYTFTTIKTVDDHCGYALPFDPLQLIFPNNAAYHDIHHQSWGIKTNFGQPFLTIWDTLLGTSFKGDTTLRYERDRNAMARRTELEQKAAEVKVEQTVVDSIEQAPVYSTESVQVLKAREPEVSSTTALRRSPRKKTPSLSQSAGSSFAAPMKELRSRMNTSLHGKGSGVLGVESGA